MKLLNVSSKDNKYSDDMSDVMVKLNLTCPTINLTKEITQMTLRYPMIALMSQYNMVHELVSEYTNCG